MCSNLAQFLNPPGQAITLMGMSGVGKTYLSGLLKEAGWTRTSCDYEIGHKYLAKHLDSTMKNAEDMDALAEFVGLVGDPAKGGLPLETFKQRQQLYYDAECTSIRDAIAAITSDRPTVIDSTGSLCEIEDQELINTLAEKTLFIYLKASKEEEQAVLERAQTNPKPLFYPPSLFPDWLNEYMREQNLQNPQDINPKDFARQVFPKLFASRLPKYEALADRHGLTIPTSDLREVRSADDFIAALQSAMKKKERAA